MRNTLKFSLLCTLLCTMSILFSNGYSMNNNSITIRESNNKKEESDEEFLSRIENIIKDNYDRIKNTIENSYDKQKKQLVPHYFIKFNNVSIEDCNRIYALAAKNPNLVMKYEYIRDYIPLSEYDIIKLKYILAARSKLQITDKNEKEMYNKILSCIENEENIRNFSNKYFKYIRANESKDESVKENQPSINVDENSSLKKQLDNLFQEKETDKILMEEKIRKAQEDNQKYREEINMLRNKLKENEELLKNLRKQSEQVNNNNSYDNQIGYYIPPNVVQTWYKK